MKALVPVKLQCLSHLLSEVLTTGYSKKENTCFTGRGDPKKEAGMDPSVRCLTIAFILENSG